MTIDPKNVPADAIVEDERGIVGRWTGGEATVPLTRVFVPVPDGVTYDDALRAVQDARPWVDWGDRMFPKGARVRTESVAGEVGTLVRFVHPDDVPDPDADLIERMAKAACRATEERTWGELPQSVRDQFLKDASVMLAVVREDGAR